MKMTLGLSHIDIEYVVTNERDRDKRVYIEYN